MKRDKQFIDNIIETFPDRLTKKCFSISEKKNKYNQR